MKKFDFKVNFLGDYSDDAIAEELKRIAKKLGKATVSKNDIETHGNLSYSVVNKRFGSLRQALEFAGLTPKRYMNATDSELLKILIDLWETTLEKEGRTPQRKDLGAYGFPVSGDTYTRRFGSWKKALIRAYESVTNDQLDEQSPIEEKPEKTETRKSERFPSKAVLRVKTRWVHLQDVRGKWPRCQIGSRSYPSDCRRWLGFPRQLANAVF